MQKMQDLDSVQLNLDQEINKVNEDLGRRATMLQIECIEKELENFSTKRSQKTVLQKLEAYTSLDTFNKMRKWIEQQVATINKQFGPVALRLELETSIEG